MAEHKPQPDGVAASRAAGFRSARSGPNNIGTRPEDVPRSRSIWQRDPECLPGREVPIGDKSAQTSRFLMFRIFNPRHQVPVIDGG